MENNFYTKNNQRSEKSKMVSVFGEPVETVPGHHESITAPVRPHESEVRITPSKLKTDLKEKATAFLKNIKGYNPETGSPIDHEQAHFLIKHLAKEIETEDIHTQINRYVDIIKLCIQSKDKELYREYSDKLRILTETAESQEPTVEESTNRIKNLIDNATH